MRGYIKLSVDERDGTAGICAEADIEQASFGDKVALLHGFKEVLELSKPEPLLAAKLVAAGVVAESAKNAVKIDTSSFTDEMRANLPTPEELLSNIMEES